MINYFRLYPVHQPNQIFNILSFSNNVLTVPARNVRLISCKLYDRGL